MKICYFARVREDLGLDHELLQPPPQVDRVDRLMAHLIAARGPLWAEVLDPERILVAVNQQIAALDTPIGADDEVAFFPPMTGG